MMMVPRKRNEFDLFRDFFEGDDFFPIRRDLAIDKVKKIFPNREVEIIDSYFEDYNPAGGSIPLKYLSKSVELLADADVAYFCFGWDTARGCKIEHQCAVEYGINRIYG